MSHLSQAERFKITLGGSTMMQRSSTLCQPEAIDVCSWMYRPNKWQLAADF